MKTYCPALFLAVLLLAAGLACSTVSGGTPIQPVTPHMTQLPTIPDNAMPAQTLPVSTDVTPKAPAFFTEEFDAGYAAENWQLFTLGKGNASKLVMEQRDDHLLFDLGDEDLYAYYMYTPYSYRNISITLNAMNRGRNNNTISLVCHMNKDASHWYEFSVTNSGLWALYAMDKVYHPIAQGGTNTLKQGKDVNTYRMNCNGSNITLSINGSKIKTIDETRFGFEEGFVGFNISSIEKYSVLPITVEFKSFKIDLPE